MADNKPRGGARPNSGAPIKEDKALNRTIRLSNAHWAKLKSLGVRWLRNTLEDTNPSQ